MIDAGKYRQRLTLQTHDGAKDAFGAPDRSDGHWVDGDTVWASVDPLSGRDIWQAAQEQWEVTHKIRMRYRRGVTPDMRLKMGTRTFRIVSVIDWEERHESLLIMAKELVDYE